MRFKIGGVAFLVAAALAPAAIADPCEAIPKKGPMPATLKPGAAFKGSVVYVGDGDSLCVAPGGPTSPSTTWIEVRLADFYAPELSEPGGREAKAALERVAMGRHAWCRAQHRSYDRVVARCSINGRDIADLLRAAGVRQGGNGWGRH